MADVTINDLPDLGAGVAAADYVPVWDVTAGQTKKVARSVFVGGALTGGGTIVTGGYTLTVPASGTVALRDVANTFSATQSFATIQPDDIILMPYDNGTGMGRRIRIERNNNVSTPAPGHIMLREADNGVSYVWADNSGVLRIGATTPDNANMGGGTVVGTQTSSLDAKRVLGGESDIGAVLAAVQAGATAVRRFTYKSGAFNGEEFEGVVVDDAPRYGMDRDAAHPAGKSLNEVTVIGDLLRAVAWLIEKVQSMEGD